MEVKSVKALGSRTTFGRCNLQKWQGDDKLAKTISSSRPKNKRRQASGVSLDRLFHEKIWIDMKFSRTIRVWMRHAAFALLGTSFITRGGKASKAVPHSAKPKPSNQSGKNAHGSNHAPKCFASLVVHWTSEIPTGRPPHSFQKLWKCVTKTNLIWITLVQVQLESTERKSKV